jgi:hypothetical protein
VYSWFKSDIATINPIKDSYKSDIATINPIKDVYKLDFFLYLSINLRDRRNTSKQITGHNMLTTNLVATAGSAIATTIETSNVNVNLVSMIDCYVFLQWRIHLSISSIVAGD